MHITVTPSGNAAVINEVAPLLIYTLAFVLALGGAYAAASAICGHGRVNMASVDFWKAQVKIQCK